MLINEILTSQEQINLVRLIMNTTLNALGQPIQPAKPTKTPVVKAVKNNRKPPAKTPKIPTPPAPKPFPNPKPIPRSAIKPKPPAPKLATAIGPRPASIEVEPKQSENMMPKRLQPIPTSMLSPINKSPSKREKQELQDKNELIDFLKTAQTNR